MNNIFTLSPSPPPVLLQYGLLYPGGSRCGSAVFCGGPLGHHSPQCLHAAAAPALLLEDRPAEPRLALQGGPLPVRLYQYPKKIYVGTRN